MSPETIKERIQAVIEDAQVITSGEDCNFAIEVISHEFEGKTPLQRHRMVNDIFKAEFASGALHALSIKTSVPVEE
ncbi:MAG: BolA/IbaG family iron-sulfur metabolism protein [Hydrogenovibrio sp.]|nr:BolA/IbaG family iron-sulfur metabolism protein [Hydrogenovibrio sp.]